VFFVVGYPGHNLVAQSGGRKVNYIMMAKTFCLLPINRDFDVLFKQWERNP
jgi:hypothetical protein